MAAVDDHLAPKGVVEPLKQLHDSGPKGAREATGKPRIMKTGHRVVRTGHQILDGTEKKSPKRVYDFRTTEPFLTNLYSFESHDSQLLKEN